MTIRSFSYAPRHTPFWSVFATLLFVGCVEGVPSSQTEREVVAFAPLLLASASVGLPAGIVSAALSFRQKPASS